MVSSVVGIRTKFHSPLHNIHMDVDAPDLDDSNAILKGILIRGLSEARMRHPDTDLAAYIEAYIMVQVGFSTIKVIVIVMRPCSSSSTRSWPTHRHRPRTRISTPHLGMARRQREVMSHISIADFLKEVSSM